MTEGAARGAARAETRVGVGGKGVPRTHADPGDLDKLQLPLQTTGMTDHPSLATTQAGLNPQAPGPQSPRDPQAGGVEGDNPPPLPRQAHTQKLGVHQGPQRPPGDSGVSGLPRLSCAGLEQGSRPQTPQTSPQLPWWPCGCGPPLGQVTWGWGLTVWCPRFLQGAPVPTAGWGPGSPPSGWPPPAAEVGSGGGVP